MKIGKTMQLLSHKFFREENLVSEVKDSAKEVFFGGKRVQVNVTISIICIKSRKVSALNKMWST